MLMPYQLDQTQELLQASVLSLGASTCGDSPYLEFSARWWTGLAALGVLALATEEGGGRQADIAAAHEALGRQAAPGPIGPSILAAHLAKPECRERVWSGEAIVGMRVGSLVAWVPPASFYIELGDEKSWWCQVGDGSEEVSTIASEPWSRTEAANRELLGPPTVAIALADLATAGYLVGAGRHLLDLTVEHARNRRQFGRPIGDFQGVAHPLARAEAELMTARQLLYLSAFEMQTLPPSEAALAAEVAVDTATRAALTMSFTAHQVHGALGFGAEAPIGRYSTRIRQVSLISPGSVLRRRPVEAT